MENTLMGLYTFERKGGCTGCHVAPPESLRYVADVEELGFRGDRMFEVELVNAINMHRILDHTCCVICSDAVGNYRVYAGKFPPEPCEAFISPKRFYMHETPLSTERTEVVYSFLGDLSNRDRRPDMADMPGIDRVIFHDPATVVYWDDGTKTVVRACQTGKKKDRDKFREDYGLAMAIAKRYFGSRATFERVLESADRREKKEK